jgi:hypothetical protein
MPKTMRYRIIRMLWLALTVFVVAIAASAGVIKIRDSQTRRELMALVNREIAVGSSKEQMTSFLRKHTVRFALDETFKQEFGGFVSQSRLDQMLFNRKVQILFKLSPEGTMQEAQIWVFYSAL